MHLPRPQTLQDILVDGLIEQAAVDISLHSVTGVEFNGLTPSGDESDAPVEVRLHPAGGTWPGTRVARIASGQWTWLTERGRIFDIAELHGQHPASDDLLRAARTLHGNGPGLLVPHPDGTVSAVVLAHNPPAPLERALAAGLPAPRRAVAAFAAGRGIRVRESPDLLEFEQGPRIQMDGDEAVDIISTVNLAGLRADAALISAEHQLLFDGIFPSARVALDVDSATAQITTAGHQLVVGAQVLATIERGYWRWAWSDKRITHTPAGQAADAVRNFGAAHLIPLFTTPTVSAGRAERSGLVEAAKAALGRWTHTCVPLPGATSVVLLEHPQLLLPPATEAAIQATLRAPVDGSLNLHRAVAAYTGFRGLSSRGEYITAPDTGRVIHVQVGGGQITSAPRGSAPDPAAG